MNAYDQGKADFHSGTYNNGYPKGTPEYVDYLQGHRAAEDYAYR